jgi:hypothetical protein
LLEVHHFPRCRKLSQGRTEKTRCPGVPFHSGTRWSLPDTACVEETDMTAVQIVIGLVVLRWIGLVVRACVPFDGEQPERS